jgi:hypothetical protein
MGAVDLLRPYNVLGSGLRGEWPLFGTVPLGPKMGAPCRSELGAARVHAALQIPTPCCDARNRRCPGCLILVKKLLLKPEYPLDQGKGERRFS